MVVAMTYEVRSKEDGELIDSNVGGAPLEFITGRGMIIPGLEQAVMAMNVGEMATIEVAAADAYGEWDASQIERRPREQFAGLDLAPGMTLYGQDEHGGVVQVTVRSFDDESVEIDFNHPLAGKDLIFDVRIDSVREPTVMESMTGQIERIGGGCCGSDYGHSHGGGGCCGGGGCH
ncbi:MAG: peptidylprolyl isomerase [Campylobacterales bacterium]